MCLFSSATANRLIVRGLYDMATEMTAKDDYYYLGSYFKETDKFALDGALGIGAEYEFISQQQSGFSCGLGYNYYITRKVPSVKVSGTVDGYPVRGTLTLDDATLYYNYAFLNLRFYPLESYYFGLQYRLPSVEFLGNSWSAGTITVQSSYAALFGYTQDNGIAVEVAVAQNSLLVDGVKNTFPVTTISLGYAIPTQLIKQPASESPKDTSNKDQIRDRLLNLDALHKDGLITDEEYTKRRKNIVDSL